MKNRLTLTSASKQLIGICIEENDGHRRITQAEQFLIIGGSQESHQHVTLACLKVLDNLKQNGKRLELIEPNELINIINKIIES